MVRQGHPQDRKNISKYFIPTTFFLTGFIAITAQTILLRELLVVALGNEIIFGIFLANWLMGIFFGSLLGGWIGTKTNKIREVFLTSLVLMIVMIPLAITLIRNLYQLTGTLAGTYIDFFEIFTFSTFIILPVAFFIGFTFPLASNLKKEDKHLSGKKISLMAKVYIFEALGFLCGGFLTSFFLIGSFNSYRIISLVVLPLLIFLAINTKKLGHTFLFYLIICLLVLDFYSLHIHGGSTILNQITIENRWHSISRSKLVYTVDSKFQNIAIGQNYEQFNVYCNGQFSSIFPEKNDQTIMAAHLISQHPNPKNILIIGEAISGLAQQLLKYNINKITSIEIDAKLVNAIKIYLPDSEKKILSDKRLSLKIKDGKKWIKSRIKNQGEADLFDIIFLNISEPSTLFLNRYYTVEFYQDLSRVLKTKGVLGLRVTSSENYAQGFVSNYTTSLYNTLKKLFPNIIIAPGEKNFFFASKISGIISDSPEVLASRYKNTGVAPRKLGLIFRSIYPPEKTAFIKKFLESNKSNILNTNEKPISLFYYNKILGWINNKKTENFFNFFEKQDLTNLVMFILVMFSLRLLYLLIKSKMMKGKQKKRDTDLSFHITLCTLNGGFFGLSVELLIIYSFQNIYGYVYQIIGFIIALFMAGLPVGALLSTKILKSAKCSRKNQIAFLLIIQTIMIIVSLAFPQMLKFFNEFYTISNILFFILTIIIGIIIGAIFPLAISLHLNGKFRMEKTAGIINAADHLGAALGAFFSGAILLPILGLIKCSQVLAAFSFFTALLLVINLLQGKNIRA